MHSLYEKLYYVIGELLCHCSKVDSISKPKFYGDVIYISVKDSSGIGKILEIPIRDLIISHDHTLENYIIKLIEDNDLR